MPLDEAVERAVDECISEGILAEFLRKNREEVIPLSIFEYDEKKHMETLRREGYEDGVADGKEEGRIGIIRKMLKNKQEAEAISEMTEEPIEYILDVKRQMLMELREDADYNIP